MEAPDNPWVHIFRWLIVVLAAILVVEVVVLLWTTLRDPEFAGGDGQLPHRGELRIEPLPPVDEFSDVIERTLFSWNRRPQSPASSSQTVNSDELTATWQLTGLVKAGESTYAIFSEMDGERQVRLEAGMELDGWTVESVDTQQITLVNAGKRGVYRLSVSDSSSIDTADIQGTSPELPEDDGESSVEPEGQEQ